MPHPARIFISYAHADEAHRKRLDVHLAPLKREGLIAPWHDRMISPGADWAGEIDRNLAEAHLVLLLVSADFVASEYCFKKELRAALDRHESGEARVIPIFVEPSDFGNLPFSKLQGLPRDAMPVSTWSNRDEAWLDVVKGIRRALTELASASVDIGSVENELIRSPLAAAAECAKPGQAIALAAHAYRRLRGMVEESVGAAARLDMWVFSVPRFADLQATYSCADGRHRAVMAALAALVSSAMDSDTPRVSRFRDLADGRWAYDQEDGWRVEEDPEAVHVESPSDSDADWVLQFVASEARRLTQKFPAIASMTRGSVMKGKRVRELYIPVTLIAIGQD